MLAVDAFPDGESGGVWELQAELWRLWHFVEKYRHALALQSHAKEKHQDYERKVAIDTSQLGAATRVAVGEQAIYRSWQEFAQNESRLHLHQCAELMSRILSQAQGRCPVLSSYLDRAALHRAQQSVLAHESALSDETAARLEKAVADFLAGFHALAELSAAAARRRQKLPERLA